MPNIKKNEYEKLKMRAAYYENNLRVFEEMIQENTSLRNEVKRMKQASSLRKEAHNLLERACESLDWEMKHWKRYYQAAVKTFKIEEYVEMPGCFNPMESIEYVLKQQENPKDPSRHYHNWFPDNKDWNYDENPRPSYVVVCDCGATGLMLATEDKVTNVRPNDGLNRHAC